MGQSGSQLEDRYFLQKVKLGQGSFGTVWRAVDRRKGNTVAIKQLDKASLPRRGVTRQDIEREVSMMTACQHENITKLFDTFEDGTSIYLALEYCDGGDFGDKVKERGWAMEEADVAGFMRQICAAIHALHGLGICHRDIKPDNFMVSGSSTLKLADFGLAIYLPRGQLAREKCGTPAFMAPEQHHLPKRSPGYSFAVDVWAAGVSMYMVMFGGKHPFMTESGHMDERLLMSGELDFKYRDVSKGFFNVGAWSARFSDEARLLCSRMVEPDPRRRISSEDAAACPWLHSRARHVRSMSVRPGHSAAVPPGPSPPSSVKQWTPERQRGQKPNSPPQMSICGCENLDPNPRATSRATSQSRSPPLPSAPQAEAARRVSPRVAEGSRAGSKAPGPQGDEAQREAARLRERNGALQAELEERKRREEQLMQRQKQLQEEHRHLQRQRTQELQAQKGRLMQRELQLQRAEQERRQMERKAPAQSKVERPQAADGQHSDESAPRPGHLQVGMRCRYESGTYGWIPAVVQTFNESDGTYNLDVRPHAALDKISPTAEVSTADAWPPGTLAAYHSISVNQWLPAVVVSFNEADGTYNLDVRDHADLDRIRVRIVDRQNEEMNKRNAPRPVI